ncbi:MAG: hypothetical protein HRT57_12825 [Crocinitomicaceae bacterium]|nr:hypothetical protein [Crocinitomicaceae bacterium]
MAVFGLGGLVLTTIAYFVTHKTDKRKKRFFMNLFNVSSALGAFGVGAKGVLSLQAYQK